MLFKIKEFFYQFFTFGFLPVFFTSFLPLVFYRASSCPELTVCPVGSRRKNSSNPNGFD